MGVISHLLIFIIKKIMIKRLGIRNIARLLNPLWDNLFGVWNADTLGTSLDTNIYRVYNGDDVNDSSGNAQHGTNVNGVTFTTGKVGNAFTFNGSNYIALPDNTFSSLTGDFTISLWWYVKFVNDQSLISNMQRISGNNYGWYLYYDSGWMYFKMGSGAASYSVISKDFVSVVPTQNVWAHITIVRKAGQSTKMYVNGVDVNAAQTIGVATTDPSYYSTQKCAIGNVWYSYYDSYVKSGAKIDAVNVWNRALNVGEIVSLYNAGNGTEYPFSTQTLPTPNDSYGTNHGTLMNGATFTTGKIGSSFTFDGINDYVALPNNSFNFTGDFSISAWVKIPSAPSSWAAIFTNYNYDFVYNYGYSVGINTNRNITFSVCGAAGISTVTSTTALALNTWYHITVKRDSVTKRSDLYINGVFEAQSPVSSVTIAYGTRAIQPTIGANRENNQGVLSAQNYLNGSVDAVSIWNRELTEAEITELYNSGNGKQYKPIN